MTVNTVKTSVIIPVYNTEDYLEACVNSVLNQTQKEIEVILVDDGSTDGSRYIIERYVAAYSCVKAVYQTNQKLGAARNAGVNIASGKYIYFLDSDDYICADLLERCYEESEKKSLDFLMFDSIAFTEGKITELRKGSTEENYDRSTLGIENKVYSGGEYWDCFFPVCGIYSNAYLIYMNADFLRKNKLYFEPGIFYEDMDWIVRVYAYAKKVAYIPGKLHFRRIHPGSIMTVHYNSAHVNSSIFLLKKLTHMLGEEQDISNGRRIISIWSNMRTRFMDILETYRQENCLEDIWPEVAVFYRYLISMFKKEWKGNEDFRLKLLLTADEIEKTFYTFSFPWETEECKKQVVNEKMRSFGLDREKTIVGIYGMGVMCGRLFSLYQKYVGKILAKIFFIDTHQKSGGTYGGYPVYNIKDIAQIRLDCIIIASERYRDEMLKNIHENISREVKILTLPEIVKLL